MKQSIFFLVCITLVTSLATSAATPKTKISYQRLLDDETIESDFEQGLRWQDNRFTQSRVKVSTYNGYVLLYGEVPSADLVTKAQEHVEKLNHVRRVFNQIEVGEVQNPSTLDDLLLSAKIKSHLWTSVNTDAAQLRYEVDRNTVYLMGLVTQQQAEKATSLVQSIDSVDKVVTLFEYVP